MAGMEEEEQCILYFIAEAHEQPLPDRAKYERYSKTLSVLVWDNCMQRYIKT